MLGETQLGPRPLGLLGMSRISALPVLPIGRMEAKPEPTVVDTDIKRMSAASPLRLVPCDRWDLSEPVKTGSQGT